MKREALLRFARLAVRTARPRMPDDPRQFAPQRFTHPSCRPRQVAFPQQAYGQPWKAETVISVVQRRFSEAITARRSWHQVKQALRRGIGSNRHRAVPLGLLGRRLVHRVFQGLSARFSTEQEAVRTTPP